MTVKTSLRKQWAVYIVCLGTGAAVRMLNIPYLGSMYFSLSVLFAVWLYCMLFAWAEYERYTGYMSERYPDRYRTLHSGPVNRKYFVYTPDNSPETRAYSDRLQKTMRFVKAV